MTQDRASAGGLELEALRDALEVAFRASLKMLRQGVERCTDELWYSTDYTNTCWQVAYHTTFFCHYYLQLTWDNFDHWEKHQTDCQYPDGIPGPLDPENELPLIPEPYSRSDVLEYIAFCDTRIREWLEAMDLSAAESGFYWYPVPKLHHVLVNLRHVQHGAAQVADRVRDKLNLGVDWVSRIKDEDEAEA